MEINFRYVKTKDNPADLLMRGLSSKTFLEFLSFWLHSPNWLLDPPATWPKSKLNSMSAVAKSHIVAHIELETMPVLLDVNQPFKFIVNLRKQEKNHSSLVYTYFFKLNQSESFQSEIKLLKSDPAERGDVPPLVNQLDLFLDDDGLFRSQGRIQSSVHLE